MIVIVHSLYCCNEIEYAILIELDFAYGKDF